MEEIKCKLCGKTKMVFRADVKRGKAKYCSIKCKNLAQFKTNIINCDGCGKLFSRWPSKVNKSSKNYCSHKCFLTNSTEFKDATRGINNRLWKGGMGKEWRKTDSSYLKWRKLILERDGRQCKYCGSTEKLEVDHLWPYKLWPNLANHPDNGQVLCHECHKKTFTYGTRNHDYLIMMREILGEDIKEKGAPSFEEIMQAKREVQRDHENLR